MLTDEARPLVASPLSTSLRPISSVLVQPSRFQLGSSNTSFSVTLSLPRHCRTRVLKIIRSGFKLHCCSNSTGLRMTLAEHSSLGVAPLPDEDEAADQLNGQIKASQATTRNQVFKVHEDRYEGVIVDPDVLPSDVPTFVYQLNQSLEYWKKKGKKGVWLKLPIDRASLVPAAVDAGFKYHHAEPAYVMLTTWLGDSPSTLPPNASHQVGIGAFVLNEKNEVLAVQEKNGPLKGLGIWKMPTGLINQAEDIFKGAVREVKEETGVDTEFVELLGFRQGHHIAFEKSDLFFVCILRPQSSEIVIQPSEIEAAQWMPLEEFAKQEFFQGRNMLKKMLEICIANAKSRYHGFAAREMHAGFQKQSSYFYYNVHDSLE